jgi:hypothetical protein
MPSSTWSRKTYQIVADVLRHAPKSEEYQGPDIVKWIMDSFALEFQMDNPRFDYERFKKACQEK